MPHGRARFGLACLHNFDRESLAMKQGLVLDKVVLLGRTLEEYRRYFALDLEKFRGKAILDVAAGVSSFCAEANRLGVNVTAFDSIYNLSGDEIRRRCEFDLEQVTQVIGNLKTYRWDFYQSPELLRRFRERAYRTFLDDYPTGRGTRYVWGRRSEEHTSELQSPCNLVCRLLLEKKKKKKIKDKCLWMSH